MRGEAGGEAANGESGDDEQEVESHDAVLSITSDGGQSVNAATGLFDEKEAWHSACRLPLRGARTRGNPLIGGGLRWSGESPVDGSVGAKVSSK